MHKKLNHYELRAEVRMKEAEEPKLPDCTIKYGYFLKIRMEKCVDFQQFLATTWGALRARKGGEVKLARLITIGKQRHSGIWRIMIKWTKK